MLVKLGCGGVDFSFLHPSLRYVMRVVNRAWTKYNFGEPVITSTNEGTHMSGSLHYLGRAIDFRIPDRIAEDILHDALEVVKAELGGDFDVLLEMNPAHIHVEYDPK